MRKRFPTDAVRADRVLRRHRAHRLPAADPPRAADLPRHAGGGRCRARCRAAAKRQLDARAARHHPPQARRRRCSSRSSTRQGRDGVRLRDPHARPAQLVVPQLRHALLVRPRERSSPGTSSRSHSRAALKTPAGRRPRSTASSCSTSRRRCSASPTSSSTRWSAFFAEQRVDFVFELTERAAIEDYASFRTLLERVPREGDRDRDRRRRLGLRVARGDRLARSRLPQGHEGSRLDAAGRADQAGPGEDARRARRRIGAKTIAEGIETARSTRGAASSGST